jgi:hypothetical protein
MKSMMISLLIVAILVMLALKYWRGTLHSRKPSDDPAATRFIDRCKATSANQAHPEVYCKCLWGRGVRRMAQVFTDARAQAAARACQDATPEPANP